MLRTEQVKKVTRTISRRPLPVPLTVMAAGLGFFIGLEIVKIFQLM